MRFEEILVLATIITGLVYLLDVLVFKKKRHNKKTPMLIEQCRSIFPVLVLVLVLRSFLAEPFRIPSGSMKPTLLEGDFILVNKYTYGVRLPVLGTKVLSLGEPQRGDIVVFRHGKSQDLIKRIVGIPGDRIEYKDKKLYVNGHPVYTEFLRRTSDDGLLAEENLVEIGKVKHHSYIYPQRMIEHTYTDITVPEGAYFVMGDNRDNSKDSRAWGFLSDKDLIGKAFLTWMSWDGEKNDIRWNRIGRSIYEYTE